MAHDAAILILKILVNWSHFQRDEQNIVMSTGLFAPLQSDILPFWNEMI